MELPLPSLAGSSKTGGRAGDKPHTPAACEEPEARSRSHSLKPPAQPKACQSVPTHPSYVFGPILCSCQGRGGVLLLHGIIAMAWRCPPVQAVPLLVSPTEQGTTTAPPGPGASSHCVQPGPCASPGEPWM